MLTSLFSSSVLSSSHQDIAEESWHKYLQRNQSVIVRVFQGQLKSTLICPACKLVSTVRGEGWGGGVEGDGQVVSALSSVSTSNHKSHVYSDSKQITGQRAEPPAESKPRFDGIQHSEWHHVTVGAQSTLYYLRLSTLNNFVARSTTRNFGCHHVPRSRCAPQSILNL